MLAVVVHSVLPTLAINCTCYCGSPVILGNAAGLETRASLVGMPRALGPGCMVAVLYLDSVLVSLSMRVAALYMFNQIYQIVVVMLCLLLHILLMHCLLIS